jgi:putative ABC transport system permease protein
MMASTSILAGAIVLAGGLSATRFQRIYEAVIFKVLGATRRPLVWMLALEYSLLGAAAGLVGSILATALAWGITHWILDIPWHFQPTAMAKGFLATVLMTLVVGLLSTYRILGQKPLPVLRRE